MPVETFTPPNCATFVEAFVVYALSVGLSALPPLSRVLVVGSRRMLVTSCVGFATKLAIGFALQARAFALRALARQADFVAEFREGMAYIGGHKPTLMAMLRLIILGALAGAVGAGIAASRFLDV